MIRAAIKSWILNLKTYLLSAFFQSLEKITHSFIGFKAAGADRVVGEKIRSHEEACYLLRFIL